MQVLEAAAIIGLIRRTQSLTGRVGVVAGVLNMMRRDRVIAVGGYAGSMATEDIDLTWRLHGRLADGVRATGRRRHAGPGVAFGAVGAAQTLGAGPGGGPPCPPPGDFRWRNHRMWLLGLESLHR